MQRFLFVLMSLTVLVFFIERELFANTSSATSPPSSIDESPDAGAAGTGISVADKGTHKGINGLGQIVGSSLNMLSDELRLAIAKLSEQLTVIQGITLNANSGATNAHSTNSRIGVSQGTVAGLTTKQMGVDEIACPYITISGNMGDAETISRETARSELSRRMLVLAGGENTIAANGSADMARQLFEQAMGFCQQESNGGVLTACTSTDSEHLSIGTLLFSPNIGIGTPQAPDDSDQLEYLQNLLYAQVQEALLPDLIANNPGQTIQELFVTSERNRAILGIGQAAFAKIRGEKTPLSSPGGAVPFIEEMLTEANLSPEQVTSLIADNRASIMAQLDAITMGMMGQGFITQQVVNNTDGLAVNLSYNAALTNRLLFKLLEMMQFNVLNTGTAMAVEVYPRIKDTNAQIRAANRGSIQ
jgi:hypothetical protein